MAGAGYPNNSEVSDYLVEYFGASAKPKGFLQLPELPLIGIGKVDKAALKELMRRGVN